jgi:hypothetical protein
VDLITSMTTGSAASLSISLLLRPVWNRIASRSIHQGTDQSSIDQHSPLSWRAVTTRTEALYLGAHAVAGASQGLLFWLSWGLAALSATSWWAHGIIVGLAYASLIVVPMFAVVSGVVHVTRRVWWVLLIETVVTCIATGMACSWNWMHVG